MTSPSAWMPVYLGDYLGKTARLTTEQHGAYLLLLFDYWRNGPPPMDDAVLAQITRLARPAWKKMRGTILAFFQERDGLLHHKRVDEELQKAEHNQERRTDKARKAANARWSADAPSNAPSIPEAMPDGCPLPSPSKKKTKPKGLSKETALPDGWKPEPFGDGKCLAIVDGWSAEQLAMQVEKFTAHHRTRGNRWADWQSAWQTWVLNSVQFAQPRHNPAEQKPLHIIIAERVALDRLGATA